ncbi:MAG: Minor extracellular protease Epr [Candidatus Dichloromethanomonas elyunquensis]|nr:MAG: Minor extracellular protease Epr [Candidatus Dichloromethanomonas elyunquensis]
MYITRFVKVWTILVLTIMILFQIIPLNSGSASAADIGANVLTLPYDSTAERLVVETAPGTDLTAIAAATGGAVVRTGPLNYSTIQYGGYTSHQDSNASLSINKEAIRQSILDYPGIVSAEWSKTYSLSNSPLKAAESTKTIQTSISDPQYGLQWGLKKIRADQVWNEGVTGQGVIVAVVDTGVDLEHPDLVDTAKNMNNLVQGYNAYTRSSSPDAPQDDHGHGTSVAGVIAALNNNKGIIGIAYNAKIMPIKAMDKNGEGEDSILADGIIWAADHGAKIINMSLGSPDETKILDDALRYAANQGCLLVGASGNNQTVEGSFVVKTGETGVAYPAANPNVIAVSAVDSNDKIADFALTGPEVLLSAPGVRVITDYWSPTETGCAYTSGTSVAAPFVSASAALLWSRFPELSSNDIKKALTQSAYDLGDSGRDNQYGFGQVDVYRALKSLEVQQSYSSPAALGWEGGKVYTGGTASDPEAVLTVPAGTFSLQMDSGGNDKKVNISLQSTDSPGDFPEGILSAGGAITINPWGEAPVKHPLSLNVTLEQPEKGVEGDQLAYLYLWSGTRWIRVGGGVDQTSSQLQVTIYEPGIYMAGWSAEPTTDRISGTDRIHTALEIAKQAFPTGTDTVIVTRADNFPDALAGAPLAYKYHAPILLTFSNELASDVYQGILSLGPKRIFILGGTSAVQSAIEVQLQQIANVTRIAGETRYATACAIADLLGTTGEGVIVNGANFPDAISVAAPAAMQGKPILLTPGDSLVSNTENSLRKLSIVETEVIGGTGVIKEDLFAQLPYPHRISGNDRYSTSAAVVEANRPKGKILYLATGQNFPDALTGGILAACNSTDILMLSSEGLNEVQIALLNNIYNKKIVVLGGEKMVSQDLILKVQGLIK